MTLDKAIRLLEADMQTHQNWGEWDRANALQLGIEALIAINHLRQTDLLYANSRLPSETAE